MKQEFNYSFRKYNQVYECEKDWTSGWKHRSNNSLIKSKDIIFSNSFEVLRLFYGLRSSLKKWWLFFLICFQFNHIKQMGITKFTDFNRLFFIKKKMISS